MKNSSDPFTRHVLPISVQEEGEKGTKIPTVIIKDKTDSFTLTFVID